MQGEKFMFIKDKNEVIRVYPFSDTAEESNHAGHLTLSKDTQCAPEVAGRLQMNIVFPNGMTRDEWETLKSAGDKAFALLDAGTVVKNSGSVHGCNDCGEEVYPKRVRNFLVCPDCLSENLVSLGEE
jgi:formylmethanofuran dehydrogenase subunit E